jgi:hypothetical protein
MIFELFNSLINNKSSLEIIYAFLVSILCLLISFKADKYFRLSLYDGLRYFRNSFLCYGIAFFWKFILAEFIKFNKNLLFFSQFVFEFFLITGSLFLLYSLIWKKFKKIHEYSSLLNIKAIILYFISLILSLIDSFLLNSYILLFFSQIFLFSFLLFFIIKNYQKNKNLLIKFYLLALFVGLIAWILNFFTAFFFRWNLFLLIFTGFLNIIFFIFILSNIIKITKSKA